MGLVLEAGVGNGNRAWGGATGRRIMGRVEAKLRAREAVADRRKADLQAPKNGFIGPDWSTR